MRLLFKQRFFSWFDSYDIYDDNGATVFTIEGKLAAIATKVYHADGVDFTSSAAKQLRQLEEQGFRTEVDYRNEKIGRKIRDAQTEKVPYMVIVGDRDMENGTVSPRHRADGDLGAMSVDEFSALLKRVVDNKEQK